MLVLTQLFQTIMRLACGMRTLNQSRQQSRKVRRTPLPSSPGEGGRAPPVVHGSDGHLSSQGLAARALAGSLPHQAGAASGVDSAERVGSLVARPCCGPSVPLRWSGSALAVPGVTWTQASGPQPGAPQAQPHATQISCSKGTFKDHDFSVCYICVSYVAPGEILFGIIFLLI